MRKVIVPAIAYTVLAAAYIAQSGAPHSVHVLSLAIFAVAFFIPSIWAAHLTHLRYRFVVCGLCALLAILAWDATAYLVIAKVEQFFILRHTEWLYALGGFLLVVLSFVAAWVASPPNQALKPTSTPSARPRLS